MKIHQAIPVFVFSVAFTAAPLLDAQSTISKAPEVGQGTSTAEPEEEGHRELFERLSKALDLTEQQKSEIKPILEQRHSQVMAVRSNGSLSKEQKAAQIRQIRHSSNEQIKNILTPAQRRKLRHVMEEIKEHRQSRKTGVSS